MDPFERRIVVRHADGPLKGLLQIMGTYKPLTQDVPQFVPGVLLTGNRRAYGIEFVRLSDRAFFYDEVLPPSTEQPEGV